MTDARAEGLRRRREYDAAQRRVATALADLKRASIDAKAYLDARPETLAGLAASVHLSRSSLSKLAPKSGEWKPRNSDTYRVVDNLTGGQFSLVARREEYDTARKARAAAKVALERAEARWEQAEANEGMPPVPGRMNLPPLPRNLVPRPKIRERIVDELLRCVSEGGHAGTVGLYGTGGFGKTTQALDVARLDETAMLFPDGVAWIEIGQRASLPAVLADAASAIEGRPPARFSTVNAAAAAFAQAVSDRRMLLILDDVWQASDLEPFLRGGPRSVRLATSRRSDVLPAGAVAIPVDRMEPAQSMSLLLGHLPSVDGDVAFPLYERSRGWPVVLGLLNGILRGRCWGPAAQPVAEVVGDLVRRLDAGGVTGTDEIAPDAARTAAAVLEISIAELAATAPGGEQARSRFLDLASFPATGVIDFEILGRLWDRDQTAVRAFCDVFATRSLLGGVEPDGVRLHEVVRDHLRFAYASAVARTSRRLLRLFGKECPDGAWHLIPAGVEAFLDQLAFQLIAAGHVDDLRYLLRDLRFLARRAVQAGPAAVLADLRAGLAATPPHDAVLDDITRTLRLEGHLLERVPDPPSAAATLHSRLLASPTAAAELHGVDEALESALVASHPMPDQPDPRLIRVHSGHSDYLTGLAWRRDGQRLATAASDRTVRLWDRDGACLRVIEFEDTVDAVSWSPDNLHLAVVVRPRLAVVVDPISAQHVARLNHAVELASCAWSPDGRYLALGTELGEILLWDHRAESIERLAIGTDSTVRGLAWGPHGLAAVCADGRLALWRAPRADDPPWLGRVDLNVPKAVSWQGDADALVVGGAAKYLVLLGPECGGMEEVARSRELAGWVTALSWHDGQDGLAAGLDAGLVQVWTAQTGAGSAGLDTRTSEWWDAHLSERPPISLGAVRVSSVGWNAATGELAVGGHTMDARIFDPSVPLAPTDMAQANCLRWHPRQPVAVIGTVDGRILLVDGSDPGRRRVFDAHAGNVRAVAFDPAGDRMVSIAEDGSAVTWNLRPTLLDGPPSRTSTRLPVPYPGAADWSHSGDLLAVGGQGQVLLLDTGSWGVRQVIEVPHLVNAVSFDPGDDLLAIATTGSELLIHDLRTGSRMILRGHTSSLGAVRWCPDGRLLSGGYDGAALLWRLDAEVSYRRLRTDGGAVWDVAIDATGQRALTVSSTSCTVALHDLTTGDRTCQVAVNGALGACDISPTSSLAAAGGASGVYFFVLPDRPGGRSSTTDRITDTSHLSPPSGGAADVT